jgi:TonB-linked SusC/RagA family outer membrane protein
MKKRQWKADSPFRLLSLLLLLCLSFKGIAQNEITVKGKVTSDSASLEGANVALKSNSKIITQTGPGGTYTLKVPANGTLVITNIGFEMQEIPINGQSIINVLMKIRDNGLNDVTIVGFGGTQKKGSMVSSITTVDVKELKGPTGNLTNALAGRIPGMISFQQSGEPGLGTNNSTFYIRGLSTFGTGKQDPLILIDGVESSPTDMARVQPDDISDFSVLKDAAAASVYGARGANGVVLINTRTGKEGAAKYGFRAENRFSKNTRDIELADNITYMNLANEAALTRSPTAVQPYTQNKINHTAAGDDPVLYPNNNWIDRMIKDYTSNQAYNLNINGGSNRARYYIAGTYNQDNGILKGDEANAFSSNIKLKNYSIRTTVNMNLSPSTELIVRVYGQFDDYRGPVAGGGGTFTNALWSNPVRFPAVYPSDKLPYIEHPLFGSDRTFTSGGLSSSLYVNPYAEMIKGYKVYKTSNLQPQLEVKQNLNFITPGLSFRAMSYLRRYAYYDVSRSYNPFFYTSTINSATQDYNLNVLNDGSATSIGTVGTEYLGYSEGEKRVDSRLWLEGSLNYSRLFGQDHRLGGTLISYLSSYETGNGGSVTASLPQRNQGLSGRFTYAYDDRYLLEFNFGYNGSERFSKSKRYGFFPSGGIGYRISNEKFFEPLRNVVTDLKLRATYGVVGNDQIGNVNDRFFYLSSVNLNASGFGASFGRNDGVAPYSRNGVFIDRYANPNITWELSKQLNIGLDIKLFNDLDVTIDVYKQQRSQILQPKSYTESAYGLTVVPSSNYGKAESRGIDVALKYQHSFSRDLWANVRGTFTYAKSKNVLSDEIVYPEHLSYLSRRGYSISQAWGYIAERLFVDTKEVANSPTQFGDVGLLAGDIKYRDVSGDGLINSDDMVPIGYPTQPEIIYGFGASMGYKRFDFSFYFQGSARSSFFIDPLYIQPFYQHGGLDNNGRYISGGGYQNGLLTSIANSHYSDANPDLYALWPRLSTWEVASNNVTSTWWMRSGDFIRLKSVDVGYTFKDVKRVGLKAPRIYLSASNVALFSKFKLWDVEMGGRGLGYPIQSVYSLGAQLNF